MLDANDKSIIAFGVILLLVMASLIGRVLAGYWKNRKHGR